MPIVIIGTATKFPCVALFTCSCKKTRCKTRKIIKKDCRRSVLAYAGDKFKKIVYTENLFAIFL